MNVYNYSNILNPIHHVGFNIQDKNTIIDNHLHDYIEIVCHIEGESSIHYIDGDKVVLKPGQYTIIGLNQVHKNIATSSNILNIVIPESFLDVLLLESSYDSELVKFKYNILNNLYNDCYEMNNNSLNVILQVFYNSEEQADMPMYSYRQKLLITEFLLSIDFLFEGTKYSTLDHNVLAYIEQNLENASLNEYARQCNYSASRVSQKILQSYNLTFGQLLQAARLQKATTLLLDPTISITTIVERVGYTNKTHFYKLFKLKYGLTPKQYRDLYIIKKDLK